MPKILELNFEGGGGKGIAYIGSLQALEEKGMLQDIDTVSGSSVGAITALALALGGTSSFLLEKAYKSPGFLNDMPAFEEKRNAYLEEINLKEDHDDRGIDDLDEGLGFFLESIYSTIVTLFTQKGWSKGDKLCLFLEDLCQKLIQAAASKQKPTEKIAFLKSFQNICSPTFGEIEEAKRKFPLAGFRNLSVAITNCKGENEIVNYHFTPNKSVVESVRTSAAYPLLFSSVNKCIDGGYSKNVGAVSGQHPPEQCLVFGFYRKTRPLEPKELVADLTTIVLGTALEFWYGSNPFLLGNYQRTAAEDHRFGTFIQVKHDTLTTFHMAPSKEEIDKAVKAGRESTLIELHKLSDKKKEARPLLCSQTLFAPNSPVIKPKDGRYKHAKKVTKILSKVGFMSAKKPTNNPVNLVLDYCNLPHLKP